MTSYRNIVLKWIRRVAILLALVFSLLVGLFIFLHTYAGKELLRDKVEAFLQKKWKTTVAIGKIDYALPNWLRLEKVLIMDRQNTRCYMPVIYMFV